MCQSLFSNRSASLLKNRLWHFSFFPTNFAKFSKTPFLQNTSGQLLSSFQRIYLEHLKLNVKKVRARIPKNMPRAFETKCEKSESKDILITYLYVLMASTYTWLNYNTPVLQTAECKNKTKPYKCIPNHKSKLITFV